MSEAAVDAADKLRVVVPGDGHRPAAQVRGVIDASHDAVAGTVHIRQVHYTDAACRCDSQYDGADDIWCCRGALGTK